MDKKEELLDAIMNDTEYDFISNNYYYFDKEQLRDIIKEYMYALYKSNADREQYEIIIETLREIL